MVSFEKGEEKMSKKCCNVQFHTFIPDIEYSPLECLILNLYSLSTTKNPKKRKEVIKVFRGQAKTLYDCCNDPSKLSHSYGELKEHAIYINQENIKNAKRIWRK